MDDSELYQMEDDNTHTMAKLEDTGTKHQILVPHLKNVCNDYI